MLSQRTGALTGAFIFLMALKQAQSPSPLIIRNAPLGKCITKPRTMQTLEEKKKNDIKTYHFSENYTGSSVVLQYFAQLSFLMKVSL